MATKPSITALKPLFNERASEALEVLNASPPALLDLIDPAGTKPYLEHYPIHELRLAALDHLLDASYGVDRFVRVRARGQRAVIHSLNTGDTYSPTIVRVYTSHNGQVRYRVTSWGEEIESLDRAGYRFDATDA